MCIIALQTKGAHLADDTIRTMFSGNPDGAGIMYAMDGRVHWEKGFFKVEDLLAAWHKLPAGIVAAMHCRIKTHGAVNAKLCHPFPLAPNKSLYKSSGDSACMLMHNGIMSFVEKDSHYDKNKDSDSSAYAKMLFDRFGSARLPNAYELEEIRDETEDSNRILLMNGDGSYVTSGEWEYKDGILYSNSHWKDWWGSGWRNSSWYSKYYGGRETEKEGDSYTHGKILGGWDDDDDDYYDTYGSRYGSYWSKGSEEKGKKGAVVQCNETASVLSEDEKEFQALTEMRDNIADHEGMCRCDLWGEVYDEYGNLIEMVDDSYLYTDDGESVYRFDENDVLVYDPDLIIMGDKDWYDDDDVEGAEDAKVSKRGNS